MTPAATADRTEGELLERFVAHPVLAGIDDVAPERFLELLLQRRFLSLMFPAIYDLGIDALSDGDAITIVRELVREEYPDPSGATPSHREDLVADLLVLGATRPQILGCRPSRVTAAVMRRTFALMGDAAAAMDDVRVLTLLRFWGEVLVAVEYGEFWPRMEPRFAAAGTRSRFYHVHYEHDGRESLAQASPASQTHSGRLGACLGRLLGGADAGERFAATEERVLAQRMAFYDQFSEVT